MYIQLYYIYIYIYIALRFTLEPYFLTRIIEIISSIEVFKFFHFGCPKTMAEHSETASSTVDSLKEKISEKIHAHDSSSSSSSDSDSEKPVSPSSVKAKIFRLFGREEPVHKVLGGGKRMYSLSLSFSIYRSDHFVSINMRSVIRFD
jgi:hypothetical protein